MVHAKHTLYNRDGKAYLLLKSLVGINTLDKRKQIIIFKGYGSIRENNCHI